MNFRTRKHIALWVLLMLFSKMAFAISAPVPSTNGHTNPAQIESHHHHEQAPAQHSQHEEMSAECELKCDCCTVHCNTPALPATVFFNSERPLQVRHSFATSQQQLRIPSSLFRPPISA